MFVRPRLQRYKVIFAENSYTTGSEITDDYGILINRHYRPSILPMKELCVREHWETGAIYFPQENSATDEQGNSAKA